MRALILVNGPIDQPERIERHILEADLIVAADGGTRHARRLGLLPHLLVGDLDSVDPKERLMLEVAGTTILQFPPHKDQTDLELAMMAVRERGCQEVIILGALGQRWDMTLANIMFLAALPLDLDVCLQQGREEIRLLRGGQTLTIRGQPGNLVSLIPISQTAEGLTLTGLEYPLNNQDLLLGSTRGVSNVMLSDSARMELKKGAVLVVVTRA